ncbi:MAG: proton-conducting transporter membrane subunit [Verrucomicrobiia bacterium]|jgi:formate hydrogenlyase subunit 3/multisubunit Na+/H+ antiporter MnhD subunit
MMTAEYAVAAAMLICFSGALATWTGACRKSAVGWIAFAVVVVSSLLVLAGVASVLMFGPGNPVTCLEVPSLGFALRLHVDGLSAVFLGLIATVAIPAALYSIEYMQHHLEHGTGRYYPDFLIFITAMYGLVSTTDMMWFFFIFWQMMTLAGYTLIRFDPKNPGRLRAANKFLIMMQIACAVSMIGAQLLVVAGGPSNVSPMLKYDFGNVSNNLPLLLLKKPGTVAMALALFLVGFGIKMGMWPFGQIWLPDAHPSAPSPVSAMLSGVMIKTGVYGLMRCFLWLVPAKACPDYPVHYWGIILTLLGTITLFTGTVQALRQNMSKRLLAFSTIGQAGYILLGLGVCMTLIGSTDRAVAALGVAAFYGTLFHTLNHGVFKSLLFLNAGSVLHATATQDLNKLGGLMRFMPVTAVTTLIASFSIAGVPLFSGFASKWGMFTAAIQGNEACRLLPLCVMVAIITSAVTLALFMKFFGVMFLTRTSALVAEKARRRHRLEVGWKMRVPQIALAAVCVLFGLMPALPISIIRHALEGSRHGFGEVLADATPLAIGGWAGLGSLTNESIYAPVILAFVLVAMFLVTRRVAKLGGSQRRPAKPWLCGYVKEAEMHRYRASGFYAEIKRYVSWMGGAPRPQPEPVPVSDGK